MIGEEELFELVGQIYRSAAEPGLWPETLRTLSSRFGGHAAALITYDKPVAKPSFYVDWNLDPDQWVRYVDHYYTTDLMTDTGAILRPGNTMLSSELLSDKCFFESEWYNDFLTEQEIGRLFVGSMSNDREQFGLVSMFKRRTKGDFDPGGRLAFERILPHLQRALDLQQNFGILTQQSESYEAILNRQATGIILLDEQGRTLFVNTAATEIFDRKDGLKLVRGRLSAARPSDTAKLSAAIRRSLAWSDGRELPFGTALRIGRSSGKPPYCVTMSPLHGLSIGPDLPQGTCPPSAVVFIRDPQTVPIPAAETLSALYGLTKSEARLAVDFVTTCSIRETAGRLGITEGTARQALKQVFQKTETHSQVALMKQLCRVIPPDTI